MFSPAESLADVFSARDIARAVGGSARAVRRLIAAGAIASVDGRYVARDEAVRAVRRLIRGGGLHAAIPDRALFAPPPVERRRAGVPLAVSGTLHAALAAGFIMATTLGLLRTDAQAQRPPIDLKAARLVFLATPGPGGGGGGGGRLQKPPPPKAQRKGPSRISSPVPRREPPRRIEPAPRPVEPPRPPIPAEKLPPIVAPIVAAPADTQDRPGVLAETPAAEPSHGPGSGGGAGTGTGTGLGEGEGSGVGPGTGGGYGGGPYRPGSGIEAPRLLREVKPDYTEEARRKGVEGDVVLEIVVRRDGGVGDIRILQSLGSGLDQRAVAAVRQWRFEPARRFGTPVDVLVEVAVEFKLR